MKASISLYAIFIFALLAVVPVSAAPCSTTQYDMMNWFAMAPSWATDHHLTGSANPLYTYRGNTFYWVKGPSGYPWDVNTYDSNYVYQWRTEYVWSDPTSYKAFDSPMPWSPRCVNRPPTGIFGSRLAAIMVPSPRYTIYGGDCGATSTNKLGYVVNEIWGPTRMSLGGSLPNNALTLTLSYRYNCSSSYSDCKYKETFDFQRPYGLVRWIYFILQYGQYVQQTQTVFNNLVDGGSPEPNHPCW